jgi:hypothetical protein
VVANKGTGLGVACSWYRNGSSTPREERPKQSTLQDEITKTARAKARPVFIMLMEFAKSVSFVFSSISARRVRV